MNEQHVEPQLKMRVSRVAELTLGIIGGIFGMLGALFAIGFGGIQSAVGSSASQNVAVNGWSALLFSTVAIVAVFFIASKPKLSGWLLVVAAVGGLISISLFFVLPFILLIIAGLMTLLRGRKGSK
jgi:hypothetical protein